MEYTNVISDFEKTIDAIYGVYLDSTSGFRELKKRLENQQVASIEQLKKTNPNLATIEYLDQRAFVYGKGSPNLSGAIELHRCTQLEYKKRNSETGLNFLFIGNMAIVSIYQFWEDHYRAEIAHLFGIAKDNLKEPIMGDIRLLHAP